ncbi:MAG: FHA domain-containing protein, partial [Myxococcota bacterium]
MRAWCPHCGAQNDFARPPTTAIVYCQKCRKPFGAAAIQTTDLDEHMASQPVLQTPPARSAPKQDETPAGGLRVDEFGRDPTSSFNTGRLGTETGPVRLPTARRGSGPVAKIVYRSADGLETDFVLVPMNRVGRHPKNNIRLNDREISKEHAVIERRGVEWWIRDLGSSNGSFVNGRRVRETKLKHGDDIQLGSMHLAFEIEQAKVEAKESAKDLVTILPQDPAGATHIHAKLEEEPEVDFAPVDSVSDTETLRRDYEKLRLSHELSRIGLTTNVSELLEKTMDVVFSMFPADNAVVMLVDAETGTLVPHTIRQRGRHEKQEIVLSSTIVNAATQERASVLASDAFLDPRFSGSQSIIAQGIRAAMCVPAIAHDKLLGIIHVDSRERVGAFTEKDLQLLKAIANQTAIAIENARLVRQIEEEARARGQLSRFLPPHVVEEMVQ